MFSYLQKGIVLGFAHQVLCFLIYKKGLCQSLLIRYYVFLFVERDCVRVCSLGIMFSYLQKGIVSESGHQVLCFLICRKGLCQSLIFRYYVFLFVERDCIRVCSLGIMFSYLQKGIVSESAHQVLCFLICRKGLCQSLVIRYYVFLFVERDCVRVCSLGIMFSYLQKGIVSESAHQVLCFLIYKKGLCQSLVIRYYVFLFVERDYIRICSLGIMFSYLQKGIVSESAHQVLCFLICRKGLYQSLLIRYYVFLFVERDCIRVWSLGIMFSYLQKGIVSESGHQVLCFLICRKGLCQSLVIRYYVFLFVERDCIRVCSLGIMFSYLQKGIVSESAHQVLCFLICRKGLCQSLLIRYYVFLFVERDCVRVCSLGIMFSYLQKGIVSESGHQVLCFLICRKGLCQSLLIRYYVFLFVERDFVRVWSLGIMFSYLQKGIVSESAHQVLCFLICRKGLYQSLLIRYYVFLFIKRYCVRVCSLGIMFSYLYKGIVSESAHQVLCFLICRKGLYQSLLIRYYVFLFVERDCIRVCSLGIMFSYLQKGIVSESAHQVLCFLICRKGLCQSLLIRYYVFLFVERDCIRVWSLGIMFSYLQKGIVSESGHQVLCFLICRKGLCQSLVIRYYVFLFVERDCIRVCSLGIMFSYLQKGIVSESAHQVLCFLICRKGLYQNLLIRYYVFLFIKRGCVRVWSLGIMFSFLWKGIVSESAHQVLCFLICRKGLCQSLLIRYYVFLFEEGIMSECAHQALCFLSLKQGYCQCLFIRIMFSHSQKRIVSAFVNQGSVFLPLKRDSVMVCSLDLYFLIHLKGLWQGSLIKLLFCYL